LSRAAGSGILKEDESFDCPTFSFFAFDAPAVEAFARRRLWARGMSSVVLNKSRSRKVTPGVENLKLRIRYYLFDWAVAKPPIKGLPPATAVVAYPDHRTRVPAWNCVVLATPASSDSVSAPRFFSKSAFL
jgi:hypothetical protein